VLTNPGSYATAAVRYTYRAARTAAGTAAELARQLVTGQASNGMALIRPAGRCLCCCRAIRAPLQTIAALMLLMPMHAVYTVLMCRLQLVCMLLLLSGTPTVQHAQLPAPQLSSLGSW
jgi:hypothetical protein